MGVTAACGRVGFIDHDAVRDARASDSLDAPANAQTTIAGTTSDTYLEAASKANDNFGSAPSMQMNGAPSTRALMRVDLSPIPTTATVFSATIHLNIEQANSTTIPLLAALVLEDWVEGTANGQLGAASWNERMPGVPWLTAGAGIPTSSATPEFNQWIPSAGAGAYDLPFDTATVQGWVSAPATNFGFVVSSNTFEIITSREAIDVGMHPTLTVVWVP